ncbi:ATP-dependent helicase, partial [Pseudomonas putida]
WTPGQQDQAEDRAYRNGQLRTVIVKIPLVENSIDQQLWQMLLAKRQVSLELIEPEEQQDALAKAMLAATISQ